MPEKTKRPPVSDAGADATEPTTAAPGQHDGQPAGDPASCCGSSTVTVSTACPCAA